MFLKTGWTVVFRGQSPRYGRVVNGVCGLIEHMKKGRLKTGSPFSDDVFICVFKDRLDGSFSWAKPTLREGREWGVWFD